MMEGKHPNRRGRGRAVDETGNRPGDEHSLDRIDPNGQYEPSNCRWADAKVQYENRRVSLGRIASRVDVAASRVTTSSCPSYSRLEVVEMLRRLRTDLVGDI